jgi:hypothetical protein
VARIGIIDTRWTIDGEITYPGASAEGLLMNVRMVNSTFEDRNRTDLDSDANTDTFISRIPEYASHGVKAFTLCLQGGMPGYEGALNSGYDPDGSLRPTYIDRVERVIRASSENGVAIILSCFYQRQDQIFPDAGAIRNALTNTVNWIGDRKFDHVVLEVANEHAHRGFTHEIIRRPDGQVELIGLAKELNPELLTTTSGMGSGRVEEQIAEAGDFIIIHFNTTSFDDVADRIEAQKQFGKPIVCNEDVKLRKRGAEVASLCVDHGCSWGLMHADLNQNVPFEFNGAADDPDVYTRLKELTR